MSTAQRLIELGIELPAVATPGGSYVPALRVGSLVFTSGQLPFVAGQLPATGRLDVAADGRAGDGPSIETAQECARIAALNALAAAAGAAGGIERIEGVVKVVVFVASSKRFASQAVVANGASDVLIQIFGDAGRHARSAIGVASLPMNAPVEVEMIVKVV